MKCPECGEELPKGARQCHNCDYELTESEYAAANPQPEMSPATPQKPVAPQPTAPQRPQKPQAGGAEMPESILSHGDVNVSSDHSTHNTQNTTHNTQNNIANTTNTTNNTQQTIIINVGAGGQLPGGIVDDTTTQAINDMASSQKPQKTSNLQHDQKGVGSIAGIDRPISAEGKKKHVGLIVGISIVIVLIIGWFVFGNKEPDPLPNTQENVEVVESAPAKSDTKSNKPKTQKKATMAEKTSSETGSTAKAVKVPTANTNSTAAVKADPYQAGLDALSNGNYSKAVEQLTAAANNGNGDAAYKLGEMYETGNGVAQNKNTAISWYQKAKSLGNKAAKRKLM